MWTSSLSLFLSFIFLIVVYLVYNGVVSAVQEWESAISIHTSPPS